MLNRFPLRVPLTLTPAAASATVAAAAVGLAVTAAGAARVLRRVQHAHHDPTRLRTGGCVPDEGPFLDALLTIHNIDGTHQGVAVAMLRDKFLPPEKEAGPFAATYEDTLRSLVEVALNLALTIAEAESSGQCDCGDPECEAVADFEVLHLLGGRVMTKFAVAYEEHAAGHARQCRACAREGLDAPGFLRARFCRDIADDLLLNIESDDTDLNGVPIAAAFDVVCEMTKVIEAAMDKSIAEQVEVLTADLMRSIAHNEGFYESSAE